MKKIVGIIAALSLVAGVAFADDPSVVPSVVSFSGKASIEYDIDLNDPAKMGIVNVEETEFKITFVPKDFKKSTEVTRPIEDIGVVVLDHKQITITQGALEALLENNSAVITCDSRHMPTGLLLPLVGNTTQNERFRDQLDASQPLRKQLWQQTMQ